MKTWELLFYLIAVFCFALAVAGPSECSLPDDDDDDDNDDAADDDNDTADDDNDTADDDNDTADDDDDTGGDDDDDDGTWTDVESGLMWQVSTQLMGWTKLEAEAECASLSLGGNNDWRLPTISDLRSLIRGCTATEAAGPCGLTDSCLSWECWQSDENYCMGCNLGEGPADGCYLPSVFNSTDCGLYWTSSAVEDEEGKGWNIDFWKGDIASANDEFDLGYRCVRDPE
ncbi:MAG: DUF1566 domain-containing protein [Candidatus Lernaella stagnicola]|nr:DUF1566 domain-containing protein [Candidatus Lernaella stagnicola]